MNNLSTHNWGPINLSLYWQDKIILKSIWTRKNIKNSNLNYQNKIFKELVNRPNLTLLENHLQGFIDFTDLKKQILLSCSNIKKGETLSYKKVAIKSGNKHRARYVGTLMAKNTFHLLIPCHRVIKSNNEIGEFSAIGKTKSKVDLLNYELK